MKNKLAILSILLLTSVLNACSGEDKSEVARQESDQFRSELSTLHQENDQLNQTIAQIYNESTTLVTQVALTAALGIHNRFTTDLVVIPPPTPTPAPVARPATRRPTRPATTAAAPKPRPRPAAVAPTPAPTPTTPPPAPLPRRPSGAVDWGM